MGADVTAIEKFVDAIDREVARRKVELGLLWGQVAEFSGLTDEELEKARLRYTLTIKSAIVMLYSHWEGCIKAIAKKYLKFVADRELRHELLLPNFIALSLKKDLKTVAQSKAIKVDLQFYQKYANVQKQIFMQSDDFITDTGNLNQKCLTEIFGVLGLSSDQFEEKASIIDFVLVKQRNAIAHNGYCNEDELSVQNYKRAHESIIELFDMFSDAIKEAVRNEHYKLAPSLRTSD